MKRIYLAVILLLLFLATNLPLQAATETWLKSKSDDGAILILADGSVWEVSSIDRIDTTLWLPISRIIIPDSEDYLINADDGEKVDVHRIK